MRRQIRKAVDEHSPTDLAPHPLSQPHPFFRREGHDLWVDRDIPLVDALCGYRRVALASCESWHCLRLPPFFVAVSC